MNMNRTFTRLLALMMAVVLALGCIGVTAFAATGTKDVTIYFYYHQDDYVKTTVQVSADATHVDMKTMNQAAKEAGIASGMGTWYIHGSYNNKILAGENANTPGVVWADVQCLYPIVDDRPVEPNLPINRMIKVNFLFEDTKQPVPGTYTMSVNQKTVLVDVQEVADLALENDLVLISLYRQIVDDEITAYVRQRLVSNPDATKIVNIYYYQQPYQQGDLPAASETVVVPVNTDMIDPSIMESKAPAGWALEVFNSRIQNDANGDPSVSVYGYANGWPVERNTYQLCLQVPAIPEKTDAVESRFTVMDGQSVTLPVVDLPDNWQFTGWLYNGQLLAPGTYDVNALIPATYENVNDIQYFVAQFKEVQTWTVSVKVGSSSSKEITYSTTVEAEKDKTPVLDHAMYERIFAAAGKEFVVSDYVSVPSRWSSVNSSNHTAYVRLVPKDESSHKLAVHFYVEDNGCIKGAFNRITSYSYTDLKTDSTGSIRIPEVQADDGYEFKGWANERGEIVFAPGTGSVLISQIPHTYLQDEASAHFYAVIVEEGEDEIVEWKLSVRVVDKNDEVKNSFNATYETYKGQEPPLDNEMIAAIFADNDLVFNAEDYDSIGAWSIDKNKAEASVILTTKEEPDVTMITWTVSVKIGEKGAKDEIIYRDFIELEEGQTPETSDDLIVAAFTEAGETFNVDDYSSIGTWYTSTSGRYVTIRLIPKAEAPDEPEQPRTVTIHYNANGTAIGEATVENVAADVTALTLDVVNSRAPAGFIIDTSNTFVIDSNNTVTVIGEYIAPKKDVKIVYKANDVVIDEETVTDVEGSATTLTLDVVNNYRPVGFTVGNDNSFVIDSSNTVIVTGEYTAPTKAVTIIYKSGENSVDSETVNVEITVTELMLNQIEAGMPAGYKLADDSNSFTIAADNTVTVLVVQEKRMVTIIYQNPDTNEVYHQVKVEADATATTVEKEVIDNNKPSGLYLYTSTSFPIVNEVVTVYAEG